MVVDDDSDVLSTLSHLLEVWGYQPIPFQRFEDARAFLADGVPDGIVVDVRLGKYNGLQLIHLAKQHHPDMAAIAVSGFDDPVLRAEAAEAGAAYILKPLELLNLRDHLLA
jgi:DNA-binding response OmpR family regulator